MNIYKISQEDWYYDHYDSAIVVAESEDEARRTHPAGEDTWDIEKKEWFHINKVGIIEYRCTDKGWDPPEKITVEYVGHTTREPGVVLASYNAG